jgi:hypothetical protein
LKLAQKLLTGAAVMLTATSAMAADPIIIPPPAPPPPMVVRVVSPFAGLYLGGYYTRTLPPTGPFQAIGAQAGYNFVRNVLLLGVEGRVGYTFGQGLSADIGGRVGIILGERFLVYGAASVGIVPSVPFNYWTVGGGAEFILGDTISIFGELRRVGPLPGGVQPAPFNQVTFGLNFHP